MEHVQIPTTLEIWDQRTGDVIAVFDSQHSAVEYIDSRLRRKGAGWLETKMLVLESDALDKPHVIACGEEILSAVNDVALPGLLEGAGGAEALVAQLPYFSTHTYR